VASAGYDPQSSGLTNTQKTSTPKAAENGTDIRRCPARYNEMQEHLSNAAESFFAARLRACQPHFKEPDLR